MDVTPPEQLHSFNNRCPAKLWLWFRNPDVSAHQTDCGDREALTHLNESTPSRPMKTLIAHVSPNLRCHCFSFVLTGPPEQLTRLGSGQSPDAI